MNNQVSYRGNQVIKQVMQLYGNDQVLYSPSELVTFSGCHHFGVSPCGTVMRHSRADEAGQYILHILLAG